MKVVVLDTDGSVKRQGLERHFETGVVGLTDLRNSLQFYADSHGLMECARRLGPYASHYPNFYMLGSGDFHHLTLLILEMLATPFLLIIFDNHTDCSFLFPKFHCGNWMYHAARLPNCRKVIHIGSTEGCGPVARQMGLSTLVRTGSVSMMPGAECGETAWRERLASLLEDPALKGVPVYVSIDKDVLKGAESPGDWDNGVMEAAVLKGMLHMIAGRFSFAGADITGEFGGRFHYKFKPVKNILSAMEHPAQSKKDTSAADSRQKALNMEIIDIFGVAHVAD